ncbi:hypothetical protein QQ045_001918 [Rhodiola kirilowii]
MARSHVGIKFPEIHLAPRQYAIKDGRPTVSFTRTEIQPGLDRLQFAIVAKFSVDQPPVEEIRRVFVSSWGLDVGVTISALDGRHILIILQSEEAANRVLAHPSRKVGQSLFRLFRWLADFHARKEPTTTTAWVRLLGLPIEVFDKAYIATIVSSFGRYLAVDERTRIYANPSYARACIEVDLAKPLLSEVTINFTGDRSIIQSVIFEGKLLYCGKCRVHGYQLSSCQKTKPQAPMADGKGLARQIRESHLLAPENQQNIIPIQNLETQGLKVWILARGDEPLKCLEVGNGAAHNATGLCDEPGIVEELPPKESEPCKPCNVGDDQVAVDLNTPMDGALNTGFVRFHPEDDDSLLRDLQLLMDSQDVSAVPDSQPEDGEALTPAANRTERIVLHGETFQVSKALQSVLKKGAF